MGRWIFAALGLVLLAIENICYQYVDDTGLLHESLLLPLGFTLVFIGLFMLTLALCALVLSRIRSHIERQ
ncbi:MAG: DUF3955 domain-containing protein [Shewanella sp.]